MTSTLMSNGIFIHPSRHLIELNGEVVPVRSKTFALLLIFLQHPLEVLTKEYLLAEVWDDVHVDEQVLFQTVRELRLLLGDAGLIKTYPRKGYAWTAPVERQADECKKEQAAIEILRARTPGISTTKRRFLISTFPLIAILLFVSTLAPSSHKALEGPLMVLPVKNMVPGSDHRWVTLGAMDQLIDVLKSSDSNPVFDTEYTLEVMQRAGLARNYASDEVAKIFSVSGTAMAIETTLSGYVEEYRLDYRLHFANDIKRGTLFAPTVSVAVQNLAEIVVHHTGGSLKSSQFGGPSEFSSELMSRALELRDLGDRQAAALLLASLKELEPHNLVARRLLAQVMIDQGNPEVAAGELKAALEKIGSTDSGERAKLAYWLAVAQQKQNEHEAALVTITAAATIAGHHNDQLYLAFLAQLEGEIHQETGNLEQARLTFEKAIHHHRRIRCPWGETLTRIQLAKLFKVQGADALAEREVNHAYSLAKTHKLPEPELL